MIFSHILLAFFWASYCVMHSLLASIGIKNKLRKSLGRSFKYYRFFYTLLSFILLAGLLYYQLDIETIKLYQPSISVLLIGMTLGLSGLSLMLICIKKYFMSLSGLLSLVKENVSSHLLITGIHRYVRHPLYLGTFAFIWGLFLVMPYLSLLIANSIITVYTLIGINLEETKLITEFGENYKLYQRSVPKLLPFLKAQQER
jgi:protein-S-isoprenylcysteine O-methyltransferase Ste14